LRKHWPGSADRRFSILTRVASSLGPRSRVCYRRLVLGFRWTVADAGWTTCLLSGSGVRLSTRKSISNAMRMVGRLGSVLVLGLLSTILADLIKRSATAPRCQFGEMP